MNAATERVAGRRSRRRSINSRSERGWFDIVNVAFLLVFSFVVIYPFWYVLVIAFADSRSTALGAMYWWPREFTLSNFRFILANPAIPQAFLVTTARTVLAPMVNVSVCMLAAFALSKRKLPFRKSITLFLIIPMFISGSIMTNYLLMVKIGLVNNFLVYILPGAFNFFTMVIMRSFMEAIPKEITEDSARIDGAGHGRIFFLIVVPLSKPIIATFLFYAAVYAWLDFGTNLLYVTRRQLFVLQYILYTILRDVRDAAVIAQQTLGITTTRARMMEDQPLPQTIKMTALALVTFPLLFVYPFFQKYFVKGMYIGAIKA